MTLKESIKHLKGLSEYAKCQIETYSKMNIADNPWIEDSQAIDIAIDAVKIVGRMENNRLLFIGELLSYLSLEEIKILVITALASTELTDKYSDSVADQKVIDETDQFWKNAISELFEQRMNPIKEGESNP